MENGLLVFVLEDTSAAPVRIEYTVRAGYSAQTAKTAGFFPLYAKLFPAAGKAAAKESSTWYPDKMTSECTSDAARFIMTVTPSQADMALSQLASCIFSPVLRSTELEQQFSDLKTSVMQYAFSTAGFINSSIDARVFYEVPWKQDSGIYPAIFTNTPLEEARTTLVSIGRNFYTPQNSALFISGGISTDQALQAARTYFSSKTPLVSGAPADDTDFRIPSSKQRRFVLSDKLFTADLAQIVVQYTSLSMMQADLAAAAFNSWSSTMKKSLLAQKQLAIRGQEYINAAAAHKNGSSRLIIQSLLEKNKTSPVSQAEAFVKTVLTATDSCSKDEFESARMKLISEYRMRFMNSVSFMDMLSQFWSVGVQAGSRTSTISAELLSRPEAIQSEETGALIHAYNKENPYVFVLVNSDTYAKYAGAFKKAGYELITAKNGSWYTQKLYDKVKSDNKAANSAAETAKTVQFSTAEQSAAAFKARNLAQLKTFTLKNGIPVLIKQNDLSATAVISLAISGGELASAQTNPGLESVLMNALADNIQSAITDAMHTGTVRGDPEVLAQTDIINGFITVECLSADISPCLTCIAQAIIYGNIKPAAADGLIYDKRSQQRIQAGSAEYQLYCRAVRQLYADTPYTEIYDADHDILTSTQYTEILAAYPGLLDASRYSLVISGKVPENTQLEQLLENTLGVLAIQSTAGRQTAALYKPDFSHSGDIRTQLRHLFFTDVSADKAGPMPEILVPTKDFADPVQYWIPSPDPTSPDFVLFNALLYRLETQLKNALAQQKDNEDTSIHVSAATAAIQAGVITFTNVHHTAAVDTLYKQTADALLTDLDSQNGPLAETAASTIRDTWILTVLSGTQTNRGTALLMRSGIDRMAGKEKADDAAGAYLSDYETVDSAKAEDFLRTARTWLPDTAPLRLYSSDSKR